MLLLSTFELYDDVILLSHAVTKKKQLYGPFLWTGFNCLKATATSRRQFTFDKLAGHPVLLMFLLKIALGMEIVSLCHQQCQMALGWSREFLFHSKSPCDGIGGSVKCYAAKRRLQRPMNNQILDYHVMLNVCEEEISKIKFFGISKETMDDMHKSLEERFSRGNTSRHRKQPPLHTTTIIQNCRQAIAWRWISCWYSWF